MKILFFTQYFWPENFRINEIINYFKTSKNSLTILTGYPTYPHKKNFINFKNKKKSISSSEFKLFRAPIIPRSDSNISIMLNYISFIISSFFYGIFAMFKTRVDVIFLFCPSPIFSALPAIFMISEYGGGFLIFHLFGFSIWIALLFRAYSKKQ